MLKVSLFVHSLRKRIANKSIGVFREGFFRNRIARIVFRTSRRVSTTYFGTILFLDTPNKISEHLTFWWHLSARYLYHEAFHRSQFVTQHRRNQLKTLTKPRCFLGMFSGFTRRIYINQHLRGGGLSNLAIYPLRP